MALEACARLIQLGYRDVKWWIVGGGPQLGMLREKVEQLHLQEHVVFTGMRENPYPYIRRADLYVQPSRVESFGLTVCEALLLGRQVIATSTDGARALLEPESLCAIDPLAHAIDHARKAPRDMAPVLENLRERDRRAMEALEELL